MAPGRGVDDQLVWPGRTRDEHQLPLRPEQIPDGEVLESVLDAVGPVDLSARTPTVEECVSVFAMVADRVRLVDTVHLGRLLAEGACVFEGAQRVLLDEWRGFHPFTTWSTTTFDNAVELIGDDPYRLGVLRCFTTRHGVGPMVTEDAGLTSALIDPHNSTGPWQGTFRVGHFDAVARRYAAEVCGGVDGIALTHVDIAEHPGSAHVPRISDS